MALSSVILTLVPLTPVEATSQNSKNSKETTDLALESVDGQELREPIEL